MVTNLCYKSSYLHLIQTHFHKRICTFSYFSSSYKFDCNRRYWMYRMGVLKRKNNSLQMTVTPSWYIICRFTHRWIDVAHYLYIEPTFVTSHFILCELKSSFARTGIQSIFPVTNLAASTLISSITGMY